MSGTVTVGSRGLVVDGVSERLLSAEVHPWRLEPRHWDAVLDTLADLGFTVVSTYVSWARHEVDRGVFDFGGALDIEAFLRRVHQRGMRAVVRIGPDTASEQEDSGYPRRILEDDRCQACRPNGLPYVLLSSTGHCFPPSYASEAFLEEVAGWYDAVVARLAPLQHPHGPIVLVQVDNELGYHFQSNTYALDHHPDAVAAFRRWAGDPAALVPTDGLEGTEVERLRWVEWKEAHLRDTLARLASMIRDRGMDAVPLFHNDYPRVATPMDLGALERSAAVDVAAADIYTSKEGGRFVRQLVRHLCGSSRLPFLAELGAGWLTLPWLLPLAVTAEDEEHVTLRAVTGGVRAGNVYMAVERDRWYASPIAADGTARPKASLYRRVFDLLDGLRWDDLVREVRVLLVENRVEARRAAARDTLGDVVPSFAQLLPIDHRLTRLPHPDTDELEAWDRELADALDAAGIDHDRATSTALPALDGYGLVVVPTLDAFDTSAWEALAAAARSGTVVAYGPRLPSLDERLTPAVFAEDGFTLLASAADVVRHAPSPAFRSDDARVDVTVWHDATDEHRSVVVTSNASGDALSFTLSFDGPEARFVPHWRPGDATSALSEVCLELGPFEIQVWEVRR